MNAQQIIENICAEVGVSIGGTQPWDLQVHDDTFYNRVLAQGSLGLGESYMLGWWDSDDLFELFKRILSTKHLNEHRRVGWRTRLEVLRASMTNVQTVRQSRELADTHYNLSNEMYEAMLGPSMAYSCAWWKNAGNLDDAQAAKFELICRKLQLKPGERLLDIGCGWGSLAKHAAENHGVEIVGITVAEEQAAYAREFCRNLPVRIVCSDYREFDHELHGGAFDKIVSVGMVEHVGVKNYRTLFETAARTLRGQGLFLLHTIGSDESLTAGDPWISKYIFPGGVLPSVQQLTAAAEELFVLHDTHNIGIHYTPTLRAWHDNFESWWDAEGDSAARPSIWNSHETFHRMWRLYLQACAADFAVGDSQVWQFVFAKGHLPDGYNGIR